MTSFELAAIPLDPSLPSPHFLGGRNFTGRVARLSPRMSHKELWTNDPTERYDTKTREVWIELDEAEGLLVGLRVDVMIDTGMGTPADRALD